MSVISKGFLGLLFWLVAGFGFTELTVLILNAWILHGQPAPAIDSVALIKPDSPN